MLYRYSANDKGKPVKKAVIYTKNEHSVSNEKIDPDAMRVITHLRDNGYESYIVGGAVRDLLVGKRPKDFDIVTDATPPRIKKLFRNSRVIGKRFRLVHVFYGAKIFEVSTFRSIEDGTVGNKFGTMDEDVCRRDFTLNALYYDPIKQQIIDYVNGVRDIRRKRVEPVIPLSVIFKDDPVRMLRAVKYAAGTGFHLPRKVRRTICKSAALLNPVSPSRLTEELIKILNSGSAHAIVSLALQTDIYMHLQPAACALMYDNKAFEKKYMTSLRELDALTAANPDAGLGERLSFIICDFIAGLTDWQKETAVNPNPSELYAKTWAQCRTFVLPMNPPRVELERAIRMCLKKLGVNTKIPKNAFSGRGGKKAANGASAGNGAATQSGAKAAKSAGGSGNKKAAKSAKAASVANGTKGVKDADATKAANSAKSQKDASAAKAASVANNAKAVKDTDTAKAANGAKAKKDANMPKAASVATSESVAKGVKDTDTAKTANGSKSPKDASAAKAASVATSESVVDKTNSTKTADEKTASIGGNAEAKGNKPQKRYRSSPAPAAKAAAPTLPEPLVGGLRDLS